MTGMMALSIVNKCKKTSARTRSDSWPGLRRRMVPARSEVSPGGCSVFYGAGREICGVVRRGRLPRLECVHLHGCILAASGVRTEKPDSLGNRIGNGIPHRGGN